MEFGIKSSRDLVSKSEPDLDDLCKKCAIRMGFARAFRSAVQNLQRQDEKIAEEAMNASVKSLAESWEEKNKAIQISQEELKKEEMELNVQNALKTLLFGCSKCKTYSKSIVD
ncbi:hypothetical protein RFI_18196 [Reticulomyxa filosa]|uniref:Uncharacterized protein n=1 Tax=Reticulomyxa filosa TaxID=46433 RepID=X6MZ05_RETFI|nr:hypothetical protein RFI_18196 [Reticulomyxa filosa]|eukprot:ETO19041.1 hypothetical protein RFI_18196 [Reticulomyxa filosa]